MIVWDVAVYSLQLRILYIEMVTYPIMYFISVKKLVVLYSSIIILYACIQDWCPNKKIYYYSDEKTTAILFYIIHIKLVP